MERFTRTDPEPGVAVLTMSRPEKLNAMDQTWFRELVEVMGTIGVDDDVRAVVLTGSGRAFSAGGDIDMFAGLAGDVTRVRPHLKLVYDAFCAVERCAVPVVAAVNGLAYGGGTELALACDVVLAGESARFSFKEATVGLMPGYGIVRGPDVVGRHWTRYLALTGRTVDAARAERAGLVQEVHPDEGLLPAAVALAA
jgi:enoyl-CoA hydratase